MWAVGRLLMDDKNYASGLGTLEPIFVSSSINTYLRLHCFHRYKKLVFLFKPCLNLRGSFFIWEAYSHGLRVTTTTIEVLS
jgi:hypothetical protein